MSRTIRQIIITEPSNGFTPGPAWWDNHIGECFEVLEEIDMIPRQYKVNIQ